MSVEGQESLDLWVGEMVLEEDSKSIGVKLRQLSVQGSVVECRKKVGEA